MIQTHNQKGRAFGPALENHCVLLGGLNTLDTSPKAYDGQALAARRIALRFGLTAAHAALVAELAGYGVEGCA